MTAPLAPKLEPKRGRGKWLTLGFLAVLAAFMYASIVVKVVRYGF
jgi:hypothetical protein